ncbi:hypothetical protein ROZALSC1DRAFT_28776 [Rozella allomycis CSF55]|uniref:Ribosomal protein L2 2 domain-containing protein n=1 Tax=Rozella allomycis (strain CSF55) TaxID=988480 RepID=A0A075ARI7_ROZAC|nr:Ribosomal protein L2 2 domain-containing protein [Rozella allomycis CSF55]RKP19649.1 hypothetical protein ROZALSC1DRAFT_28776 [Rozella allomycis CSF55]|eukprot:EPZ32906.1 Ribosomal protein L2 2 domain-containing protein [Rozella allomycis CSF55]
MVSESRNKTVAGVTLYSRSKMYKMKGCFKRTRANAQAKVASAEPTTVTKPIGGEKNGKTRVVSIKKESRYYPAYDIKKPLPVRKTARMTKLRQTIVPGTVLILLAGRFRGKRVVFLKQLSSGLLLVTGPYKINGVPLKRVNQSYVIATSTKVDIAGVNVENIDDSLFKRSAEEKKKEFLGEKETKKEINPAKIAAQKEIDAKIIASVKKVPRLSAYLNASFSLTNGQAPHLMKF